MPAFTGTAELEVVATGALHCLVVLDNLQRVTA